MTATTAVTVDTPSVTAAHSESLTRSDSESRAGESAGTGSELGPPGRASGARASSPRRATPGGGLLWPKPWPGGEHSRMGGGARGIGGSSGGCGGALESVGDSRRLLKLFPNAVALSWAVRVEGVDDCVIRPF